MLDTGCKVFDLLRAFEGSRAILLIAGFQPLLHVRTEGIIPPLMRVLLFHLCQIIGQPFRRAVPQVLVLILVLFQPGVPNPLHVPHLLCVPFTQAQAFQWHVITIVMKEIGFSQTRRLLLIMLLLFSSLMIGRLLLLILFPLADRLFHLFPCLIRDLRVGIEWASNQFILRGSMEQVREWGRSIRCCDCVRLLFDSP